MLAHKPFPVFRAFLAILLSASLTGGCSPGTLKRSGNKYMLADITQIDSVAFSPNGKDLAAGTPGYVFIIDLETGNVRRTLPAERDSHWKRWSYPLSYSEDGSLLAAILEADDSIRVWDTQTWKEQVKVPIKERTFAVAFSSDCKVLAEGGSDGVLTLVDINTGVETKRVQAHAGAFTSVAFARGGKILASAGEDRKVRLWDSESGTELISFEDEKEPVRSLVFSPDGKSLAGWSDGFRVWRVEEAPPAKKRLEANPNVVERIAFGLGAIVVTTLIVLAFAYGLSPGDFKTVYPTIGPPHPIAFSPDGRTLAVGDGGNVAVVDLDTKEVNELKELSVRSFVTTFALAFSPDGRILAMGRHNWLESWNPATGQRVILGEKP